MSNQLLEQMMLQGYWLSQDGTTVTIMDMDDRHLSNAYRIAREGLREGYSVYVDTLKLEMMDRGLITSLKEMANEQGKASIDK